MDKQHRGKQLMEFGAALLHADGDRDPELKSFLTVKASVILAKALREIGFELISEATSEALRAKSLTSNG